MLVEARRAAPRHIPRELGPIPEPVTGADDVAQAIAKLRAAGALMIDEAPRPGAHGTRIAFVHPKSTGGVLMELVEEPRDATSGN